MKPDAIGPLHARVRFEKETAAADDGLGNVISGWQTHFECAAVLKPLRGGEQILGAKLTGVMTYSLVVRRCAEALAVTPQMRAVVVRDPAVGIDTVLNIRTPAQDGRGSRDFLEFLCESGRVT